MILATVHLKKEKKERFSFIVFHWPLNFLSVICKINESDGCNCYKELQKGVMVIFPANCKSSFLIFLQIVPPIYTKIIFPVEELTVGASFLLISNGKLF